MSNLEIFRRWKNAASWGSARRKSWSNSGLNFCLGLGLGLQTFSWKMSGTKRVWCLSVRISGNTFSRDYKTGFDLLSSKIQWLTEFCAFQYHSTYILSGKSCNTAAILAISQGNYCRLTRPGSYLNEWIGSQNVHKNTNCFYGSIQRAATWHHLLSPPEHLNRV